MSVISSCTRDNLIANAKCFNCFSLSEKNTLKVYFLAQSLRAAGGANLTNFRTLNSTIACLNCEPDFVLDSMLVAAYQKEAAVLGASVDLTPAALKRQIACQSCGADKLDRTAEVYLRCSLALLGK